MKKLYFYARSINLQFWRRVANSSRVDEPSLGIFRWIFGIFFLSFSLPQFRWISQVPDAFFDPPYLSLTYLINGFPPKSLFYIVDILILLSITSLTLGIKARVSTCILLISWMIGNHFKYSFGKIDHGNIMVLALLLCMIYSNWGAYYAIIPDKLFPSQYSQKAIALFSVLLAFAMFTAGFEKALKWIDFDFSTNGFLAWFYQGYYDRNKTFLLAPTVLYFPKWIFEFVDYVAVIFELSPFIALLSSKKWWLCWLFAACLFHLSNTLLLNIPFLDHFVIYLVFVNFYIFNTGGILSKNKFYLKGKIRDFLIGFVLVLFTANLFLKIFQIPLNINLNLYYVISVFLWTFAAIIILINFLSLKKSISR